MMYLLEMTDSFKGTPDEELARQMKAAGQVMRENQDLLRALAKNELVQDSEQPHAEPIR